MEKRICIGKIVSAHGIKGLVKVLPFCDDLSLLGGKVYLDESGKDTLELTLKNPMGKFMLAQIKGINDRTAAENIRHSLYIPRDQLPEIEDEGEYYIEDLIGLDVLDENAQKIAHIVAVQNFGAGDLLEIKPTSSATTYFIPFQDEYITEIRLEQRTIVLRNIENFIG